MYACTNRTPKTVDNVAKMKFCNKDLFKKRALKEPPPHIFIIVPLIALYDFNDYIEAVKLKEMGLDLHQTSKIKIRPTLRTILYF